MEVTIKKNGDTYVAQVTNPIISHMSDPNPDDFAPFRNGIIAEGATAFDAFENIKKNINRYINVYHRATGGFPRFAPEGSATFIFDMPIHDIFPEIYK